MATPTLIELRKLNKFYFEAGRERVVLHDVDAEIRTGEFVVLVGRSGSGKSTLLNLISGIDVPSSGEIIFNGHALHRLDEHQRTLLRRRDIGFIFQAFNLIPHLTVIENLRLPLELNGTSAANATNRCMDLLGQLSLADRASTFPDRLSGGEQQRVAVVRALVHDPRVVLADEPTGNLDLDTGREVLKLLDELTRAAGKTLVMVTHSQEVIGRADRIFTIRHGRLSASV